MKKKKKATGVPTPNFVPVPFTRAHSDRVRFNSKEQRTLGKKEARHIQGNRHLYDSLFLYLLLAKVQFPLYNNFMKTYRKLVRDQIPNIMTREGQVVHTEELSDEAFRIALVDKLQEATVEYSADPNLNLLVDILELTYTIAGVKYHLDPAALEAARRQRLQERGSFAGKTFLIESEAN